MARIFLGPNAPDSIYLAQVSVQSDNYIELKYHSLPPNTVKKIVLERSVNPGAGFQAIDSISTQNGFLPSDYLLNDSTADVHNQSYYYRLIAIDSCGTIKKYSNIGRSILLHCVEDQTDNQLSWNAYETWLEGVDNYKAFRTINGQPTAGELIVTQSSWILTYSDPLTTIDPNKSLCYWIEANENAGNPYLNNAISLSNTCCIIKEGTLFMPNAFCPDGINYRFRPVTTFIDPLSFNLTIFNRFGQQIFETSDMSEGWNGMVSGQPAPLGLYVYLVSYKSATGKEYTKRSSVFLVR